MANRYALTKRYSVMRSAGVVLQGVFVVESQKGKPRKKKQVGRIGGK